MAFNWPAFRTRTLTAIIFAGVMLAGLLWNRWSFFILFSVIHFGCWWEYLKLTEKIFTTSFHINAKLGFMLAGYGLMLWFCGPSYEVSSYGLKENLSMPVSGAGFLLLVMGIFQGNSIRVRGFLTAMAGILYISLTTGLLLDLAGETRNVETGEQLYGEINTYFVCLIIFSLWINDTMAYIVGSFIGKTPLSKISPKKTWEGTIGGIILCSGLTLLILTQFNIPGADPTGAVLAFAVAIAGTTGDLFESKLKRMAGVKDSGTLLPGHGGFLDRFDSLLFAVPVAWLLLKPCLFNVC